MPVTQKRQRATHQRMPREEIRRIERLLSQHLSAGYPPKAFAIDHGVTVAWAYVHARALGWGAVYCTHAERAVLLSDRQAYAAAVLRDQQHAA